MNHYNGGWMIYFFFWHIEFFVCEVFFAQEWRNPFLLSLCETYKSLHLFPIVEELDGGSEVFFIIHARQSMQHIHESEAPTAEGDNFGTRHFLSSISVLLQIFSGRRSCDNTPRISTSIWHSYIRIYIYYIYIYTHAKNELGRSNVCRV